uniref:Uncharacterized protein n=1 Tax=Maylandia zebra TaxID=106582 RepID=A0A3P9AVR9_9CICH
MFYCGILVQSLIINSASMLILSALCSAQPHALPAYLLKLSRVCGMTLSEMDTNFRMVFLFQEKSCSGFIKEVQNQQPRMLKFLEDLEQCAVQLDRMNKGAKISSITGSSVGAVGGVLSIVGLALSPVTAGASLGLLIGGTVMGILSGTNSAVTTFTEIGVNHQQRNKANDALQKFRKDVQSIQDCLGEVINQSTADKEVGFYKDINAPKMASEIQEMSQASFKGSLALSKTARAGFIALNALFLGMDIYSICKDSISLAKANKTEISQFIRARASLLKSEMNSWENIYNSLNEGLKTEDKKKAFLEIPFIQR